METMRAMRPMFARAVVEHEALMAEADAAHYLRHTGWLKLYRSEQSFAGTARERALAAELGMPQRVLDLDAVRQLLAALAPVFRHAVFWGAGGEHLQSAGGHSRLCVALCNVGRRHR